MRIKSPGLYELTDTDYFSDPCPKPSLTQSLAKVLLRRSPQHMWYQHPRLNPSYVEDDKEVFDLGSAAHSMLFDRGKTIAACDFEDWRKKEAKEIRARIRADGNIPVLQSQYERVIDMVQVWRDVLEIDVTATGQREATVVAEIKGVWLRAKLDWIDRTTRVIIDYKTTQAPIERNTVHNYAFAHGWHLQAAMHEKILDYLYPTMMGKRQHLFVLQEAYRPYAIHKCQLGEAAMELGGAQINEAIAIFKRCLDTDRWPGPSEELLIISPPAWGLRQHEEAKLAEEV